MMTEDYLYRLSRFSSPAFTIERTGSVGAIVHAEPVFAGPDAAIEVEGNVIKGFINGAPSYDGGQLSKLIARYRDQIYAAAMRHWTDETKRIVFSGTWHHIDFDAEPRFEGYLLHTVKNDGSVASKLYEERIFEWDAAPYRAGYGFITHVHGPLNDFADTLNFMANHEVCKTRGRYIGRSGLGAVGGMLWLTDRPDRLPFLYSAGTGSDEVEVEFELEEEEADYNAGQPLIGDGLLSAAVLSKLEALKDDEGWFRGKDVKKSIHRPKKLRLAEMPEAIDAIGYWIQARSQGALTSSEFRLFGGVSEWRKEVLEKVQDGDFGHLLGNLYASDWSYEPTADQEDREIRLLALGPIPQLSQEPL